MRPDSREILAVLRKNRYEEVQIAGVVHNGVDYLDVRVYKLPCPEEGRDEVAPTGRGVTVKLRMLPELLAALEAAKPYFDERREALDAESLTSRRESFWKRRLGPSRPSWDVDDGGRGEGQPR